MARPNKFFSFALLISLITFSSTSFLTANDPDEKSGILNKENESQLGLNSSTEDENKEEQGGSYLPSLPGLPTMSAKKASAARALIPVVVAIGVNRLPTDFLKNPYGNIVASTMQAGCAAVAASSVSSGSVAKSLLKNGIRMPIFIGTIAGGLQFGNTINEYASLIPKIGTYLAIKNTDDQSQFDATPSFTIAKIAGLTVGAAIVSPYLSKAIKAAGKKLGYIEKAQKEEPATN